MPILALAAVDLVAMAVALLCILLLLAGNQIFRVIAAVFSKVPVIGGTISSVITSTLADTMASIASTLESQVAGWAEFLWGLAHSLWNFANIAATSIADAKNWAFSAWQHADNLFESSTSTINARVQAALGPLEADIGSVQDLLNNDIAALSAAGAAGTAAAEALAHALADQVQSEAATLFGQAEAAATAGVQQAEALAQALADQVQSEAVTLFGQAEGAIGVIQGQVQALPGQIEGTIPGIVDGIVPGIIAGAIPGILAQVIPRVAALEAQADECLEPLCDTVTPNAGRLGNLGNLFKGLEDLAVEAVILALAAEAVHNPAAVAHDVETVVSDVGGGALRGFRGLVGI